jgi:hypothetical protein
MAIRVVQTLVDGAQSSSAMQVLESVHAPPVATNGWQVPAQYAFGPQDTMAPQVSPIALKAVHTPSQ